MTARMDGLRARLGGVAFGGDYNPEQWERATWLEDVRLMQRAGVNLVTVGVFSWASVEPAEGVFTFDWLDEVLDLLHEHGIAVDLATPTMAPPAWLWVQDPDTLPVTAGGQPFGFGNRLHYDPSSPTFRRAAERITEAIAARYARHPAVVMWHISNEFGPVSFSAAAAEAFRAWLQRRYGCLEALNDAWYTRFWGQVMTDWEQVDVPAHPRTWMNPARRLDFERFSSDVLLELDLAERDIVRRYSDLPVTTNFMRFAKRTDAWRWAVEQDVVSLDIYPNPADEDSWVAAALHFDLMRSLKQASWLLMEQAASAVSQWPLNAVKRPGMMRLGSYQAIAHGSDSVLFFQWRASRGGHERFHSAMLPHSGTGARSWREVEALGGELPRIAAVAGTTQRAEVAVLHDWQAWWALSETAGLPRNDFDYPAMLTEYYRPLLTGHLPVDLVSFGSALQGYRMLVIPNAYLVPDAFVAELTRFVERGGTVVCGFFSGVVDEANRVRQPAYPGAFRRLLGAYIDEFWPARPGESFDLVFSDGRTAVSDWWQDSITLESAVAVATYGSGLLVGRPAITENQVGRGRYVHLGTRLAPAELRRLLLAEAARVDVRPLVDDAPATLEVTVRSGAEADHVFLLNHDEQADAALLSPVSGVDLLSGEAVTAGEPVVIAPLGVRVLRTAPA